MCTLNGNIIFNKNGQGLRFPTNNGQLKFVLSSANDLVAIVYCLKDGTWLDTMLKFVETDDNRMVATFTGTVNGKFVDQTVTTTELNYMSGATSNIQNQINTIKDALSSKIKQVTKSSVTFTANAETIINIDIPEGYSKILSFYVQCNSYANLGSHIRAKSSSIVSVSITNPTSADISNGAVVVNFFSD